MNTLALSIAVEPFTSRDAQALVAAQQAELGELYGAEHIAEDHDRIDPRELADGNGVFVIARLERVPIGCGAVRRLEASIGEIKRMYVAPAQRGRGVARQILEVLEEAARGLGLQQVVLETGDLQLDAIRLYERAGYTRIPCFGDYALDDGEGSLCFSKLLTADG